MCFTNLLLALKDSYPISSRSYCQNINDVLSERKIMNKYNFKEINILKNPFF